MLVHFILSQKSLILSSLLFILFPLSCSKAVISTILSSSSLLCSSSSLTLLLIPSSVIFHFNYCIIITVCSLDLFFVKHFLYLLGLFFSLRSWIIFTIIILNSFLGRLPISISLSCSSRVIACSFVWNIILCHLILSNFL